jgi:hypothetical protein
MRRMKKFLLISSAVCVSACSGAFDNSRYYGPEFSPTSIPVALCPYSDVRVNESLSWIVIVNAPQRVTGCGPRREDFVPVSGGRAISPGWRELDGGGGMAGTNYSLRTLLPEERERERSNRKPAVDSPFFVEDEVEQTASFVRNGLRWEHSVIREFTRFPQGGGNVPGDIRAERIRDMYIYKHPEGWWLRVQANFNPGMESVPAVLASRRETLREVVDSIRIEPKDASRVSCTTDDKGRESCRYHWPDSH